MKSPTDTDRLIQKALALHFGCEPVTLQGIEQLDAHLHGHAFKYVETTRHVLGVYPYRVTYADGSGEYRSIDVMLKAKPSEASILRVYQGLLNKGGIKLATPLADCLRRSDYATPNLKEAILFRDFSKQVSPYLPASFGVIIDPASGYTLRLEEILPLGSVVPATDDDTTTAWKSSFPHLALTGLADLHARFCNNHGDLTATGYFQICDTDVMSQARDLWSALCDFVAVNQTGVVSESSLRRHRTILETLPEWYPLADQQPKTLLYGDVNPQNLAFAKTAHGFQLSLFDWERAVISLPQRDLAEYLLTTLPDDFTEIQAAELIEIYRTAFAQKSAIKIDRDTFIQGLIWMLYDLILNRLPLMLLVKHVTHKRRHSPEAYHKAHRLLDYLERSSC